MIYIMHSKEITQMNSCLVTRQWVLHVLLQLVKIIFSYLTIKASISSHIKSDSCVLTHYIPLYKCHLITCEITHGGIDVNLC